jgi:uncharacterized protein YjbI with pentapeptide repeats
MFRRIKHPHTGRFGRRRALAAVSGLVAAVFLTAGTAAAVGATTASCTPGSGPDLAGRHLTSGDLSSYSSGLQCANLTGADLSGLSLAQVDFTGAVMRDANLQGADLSQATLDQADLSGANLSNAQMVQASAQYAKLVGADLASADFTQADLTGADLARANLSGTTFSQATLNQANFAGVTGVPPYSLYLLIVAGIILTLLIAGSIRRGRRALRLNRQAMSGLAMSRTGITLARGLVGSLVVALGFHLFLGGLADEVVSSFGPPLAQTCSAGALCTVGVASGFLGLFGGVLVIIVGFAVWRAHYPAPGYADLSRRPVGAGPMFGGFPGPGAGGFPGPGSGGPAGPATAGFFDPRTGEPSDPESPWS